MSGRTFSTFSSDEECFDAVLFNLQVIGESIKRFPQEARAVMSDDVVSGPARMRDLIAHHYFSLDPEIIWEVATTHVPALLVEARAVRDRFDTDE